MALSIYTVPDSRQYLAEGQQSVAILAVPGASDYVTGGYVVNALASCGFKLITDVNIVGVNSTVVTNGWQLQPILNMTLASNNVPILPTTFNLWVGTVNTTLGQVAANTNLTGAIWTLRVTGC